MATLIRIARRLRCRDEGAELIEMALVTPILLFLVMGVVDFGFLFQRYVVLTNAAIEGARVATMPGYTVADAQARVQAYAAGGGVPGTVTTVASTVTLPGSTGGTWPGVEVTVTHVYDLRYISPIVSLLGGSSMASIPLTARATMRRQVAGS